MALEGVSTVESVQPQEQTAVTAEPEVTTTSEAITDHGGDSMRGEPDLIASIWRHQVEVDYEQQVVSQTAPAAIGEGPATEAETGAEAATRLSNADNPAYQGPEGENNRANDFAAVIHLHQNDQTFLAEMFQGLGPEQSAQMVARSSNLGEATLYNSEGEEVATFDATSTVARGLSLADRSLSSQWDQRFAQAAARDERTALAVSDVLGNSGMEAGYLQRVFLNEVMRPDRALSATSGDRAQSRANVYARAAGEVLAENPALAHEYLGKNGRLTVEQRGQLIRNAAYLGYNGTQRDGFDRAIANLSPDDLQDVLSKNRDAVNRMVESYGTHYPSNSLAFANLLNKASQIRGAEGRPSAEAIDLFLNSIDRTQRNNHTKEAVKSFFRTHTDAVLDRLPKGADGFLTTESYNRLTRLPDGLGFPRFGTNGSSILGARDWLRNNSSSSKLQAEFMHRMMNDETGRAMLRMTVGFSDADKQLYANAINAAYRRNPQVTLQQIRNVGDTRIGAIQGAGQGFPEIIAKTGNYDIINSYATHLLEQVKATDAYQQGGYGSILGFDAGAALKGLSSNQLQRFLSEHATDDLTRVLTNTLGSNRYPSTALGQLLRTASQIEAPYYDPARGGLSYKISDEALRFFADAVPNLGNNTASREGAGAFFVENAVAVVDALTRPLGDSPIGGDPASRVDVLRNFFSGVVFSPGAESLRYNGGSLLEAIGGDIENGRFTGRGGALADVSQALRQRALYINNDSRLTENDKEREINFVGRQLGYVMAAMQAGFLQNARANQQSAEFKAGLFGAMAASLASTNPYTSIPSDLIGFFTEEVAKKLLRDGSVEDVNATLKRSKAQMTEELDRFARRNGLDASLISGYGFGLDYLTDELIRHLLD